MTETASFAFVYLHWVTENSKLYLHWCSKIYTLEHPHGESSQLDYGEMEALPSQKTVRLVNCGNLSHKLSEKLHEQHK